MAAFLLLGFACAPPTAVHNTNVIPPTPSSAPSPKPSPTPTVPVKVSASAPFHGGEVGVAYPPVALTATGGVAPYKWTLTSGALPGGLSLGADGTVSGTPTAAGTFVFTIHVSDSGDSSAGLAGTINIAAPISATLLPACATYCYVELGCVDVCGDFGSLGGGVSPYSFSLVGGSLPRGTSLYGFSLRGTFTGLSGWLQFTVQVSDAYGGTATIAPKFWMLDHISFPGGAINQCPWPGCQASFPYTGGSGTPSVSIVGWSYSNNCYGYPAPPSPCPPPAQPTVGISGGNVVVTVPSPGRAWINGYKGTLTLRLTDQNTCGSGVNCSTTGVISISVSDG